MKIRLLGKGYEVFTGAFGSVEFVNGVSVTHVSGVDARFYAALMPVENADDGIDPGANAQFQASLNLEAVYTSLPTLAEIQARDAEPVKVEVAAKVAKSELLTLSSLEKIADADGIVGLREIGDPLGVKGTSITKLIDGILATQAPTPAAATLAEVPSAVVSVKSK